MKSYLDEQLDDEISKYREYWIKPYRSHTARYELYDDIKDKFFRAVEKSYDIIFLQDIKSFKDIMGGFLKGGPLQAITGNCLPIKWSMPDIKEAFGYNTIARHIYNRTANQLGILTTESIMSFFRFYLSEVTTPTVIDSLLRTLIAFTVRNDAIHIASKILCRKRKCNCIFHRLYKESKPLYKSGLFPYFRFGNIVIALKKPNVSLQNGELHNEKEATIKWGSSFYFLHDVFFEKPLWTKIVHKTATTKELLSLENTEQRRVALKYHGLEELLKESGKLIHQTTAKIKYGSKKGKFMRHGDLILEKKDGFIESDYKPYKEYKRINELWKIENVFDDTEFFLKLICPSSGRTYVEAVDPELLSWEEIEYGRKLKTEDINVDELVAKQLKSNMTLKDYNNLTFET